VQGPAVQLISLTAYHTVEVHRLVILQALSLKGGHSDLELVAGLDLELDLQDLDFLEWPRRELL